MATNTTSKVWLITGAPVIRSWQVVANPDKLAKAIGSSSNLLVVKLDIMKSEHAVSAIEETIKRFCPDRCAGKQCRKFLRRIFEEQHQKNSNAN
jgi:hypothetical protein